MKFLFQPMTASDARQIVNWRYEGAYSVYDMAGADLDEEMRYLTDPASAFYAIHNLAGTLVGFCSFGEDGQVPGYDYSDDALDVGAGMRPDLIGRGAGDEFIREILDFARATFQPPAFRATIQSWNERALRMVERAGFQRQATFLSPAGVEFTVVLRPGDEAPHE